MDRRHFLATASVPAVSSLSGCMFVDLTKCLLQTGSIDFSLETDTATAGEEVVFRAEPYCVEVGDQSVPERVKWKIGSAESYHRSGKIISHTFDSPGSYPVTVKYNQGLGSGPTHTETITIIEGSNEIRIENSNLGVHLRSNRTEISLDEAAILQFSATNLIGNKRLTVQLMFDTPSGLQVTGTGFVESGSGQYTRVTELEPGENTGMSIRLQATEPGTYHLTGHVVYYFEGEETEREIKTTTIPIIVSES